MLGTLGSGALAGRNLFDEDYTDCPSGTRLQALSNVRVMRTDEEDELKVTWDMTQPASWQLGPNVYSASITLILESDDKTITSDKALGSTSHTFEDLAQSTEWKVQVAVTDRGYVISDIVEADITSNAPAPFFAASIWYGQPTAKTAAGFIEHFKTQRIGRFYYLGFNKNFANWYITRDNGSAGQADLTPKFRVGLRFDLNGKDDDGIDEVTDVGFDHFRVRVVDSGGDDVLGFDAATVMNNDGTKNVSPAYQNSSGRDQGLTWSARDSITALFEGANAQYKPGKDTIHFANHTRSNKLDKGGAPALRSLFVPDTAYALATATGTPTASDILEQTKTALSFGKVSDSWPQGSSFDGLWSASPDGFYDMPADIFMEDDNYTITGWLENEDDEQISPRASITFSARTVAYIAKTAHLWQNTSGTTWTSAAYTDDNDVRAHVLALTILDDTNEDDYLLNIFH